jgi:glycosyltransferase involved in cell wall biosynthesis
MTNLASSPKTAIKMKIALNAASFSSGRMGGVETYFLNLIHTLQKVDKLNEYQLICNMRQSNIFRLSNPRFSFIPCIFAKPLPLWYLRTTVRHLASIDILRPFMNSLTADVIHHPFSVLQPIGHKVPSVLTFHDMQHEFFPENFSQYAIRAREKLWKPSADKASRIIAISEYAKRCLIERYEINPCKIDVVYNGYDDMFCRIDEPDLLESVRSRYGLHRPFMYYPAATWPHKNHKRLLGAFKLMKERFRFDGQLVLSGIAMQAKDEILEAIRRFGLRDDVLLLGYLPHDLLPFLYNLARMMVFPSLSEGFGFPLVEAMACGCPVACSNVTSIPEVAGDAALLFDPLSEEEMAEQIWRLWSDAKLQEGLREKGLKRVSNFSSENMALQTIQVYEKAVQR